jgi:murein DD-endopeptidase MepM/ murein hydrolase activator NlpD
MRLLQDLHTRGSLLFLFGVMLIFNTSWTKDNPDSLAIKPDQNISANIHSEKKDLINALDQSDTNSIFVPIIYIRGLVGETLTKTSVSLAPDSDDSTLPFDISTFETPPRPIGRPASYPIPWALAPHDHFFFARPIGSEQLSWPVADYRYGGVFYENIVHSGVDIKLDIGTPVLAAAPGKIIWAGYGLSAGEYDKNDPYGKAILIRHDFGFQGNRLYTVYAHLDRVDVEEGQIVRLGQQLGVSGKTGKASGPHLHFEVRYEKDGFFTTYNPELWIAPAQGWGVLAGRLMNSGGRRLPNQLVTLRSQFSDQMWQAISYAGDKSNSDPYYQENLVISDIPAGKYELQIDYLGRRYLTAIEILPGRITFFTFRGRSGFTNEPPSPPGGSFLPPLTP